MRGGHRNKTKIPPGKVQAAIDRLAKEEQAEAKSKIADPKGKAKHKENVTCRKFRRAQLEKKGGERRAAGAASEQPEQREPWKG